MQADPSDFDPLLAASGRKVVPINFEEPALAHKGTYVSHHSKTSPKAGGGFGRFVKAHASRKHYLPAIGANPYANAEDLPRRP